MLLEGFIILCGEKWKRFRLGPCVMQRLGISTIHLCNTLSTNIDKYDIVEKI